MQIMKSMTLTLLFIFVFSIINGCDLDSEPLIAAPNGPLNVMNASQITDIRVNEQWMVVSSLFEIQIYDIKEDRLLALLTSHPSTIKAVTVSSADTKDSCFIAVGCSNGTIRIWDAKRIKSDIEEKRSNGVLIFTDRNTDYYKDIYDKYSSDAVKVLSFSSKTNDFLIGKSRSGEIKIWDFQSWDVEQDPPEPEPYDVPSDVTAFNFSENGSYFVIGESTGKITIRQQPNTARSVKSFESDLSVKVLLFLPFLPDYKYENRYIVSASNDSKKDDSKKDDSKKDDSKIVLWDLNPETSDKMNPVKEFRLDDPEVKSQEITALAFLNYRKLLVAGTCKGNIYLWDNEESGRIVNSFKSLKEHHSMITALAAADGGTILVSVSDDGIIVRSDETDFGF